MAQVKPKGSAKYTPDRGDVVWLQFNPQAGHEQAGHRPALVLSPIAYNRRVGLAVMCPITSHVKGYPFEVEFPAGSQVTGAVLADQVKTLDWKMREAALFCRAPISVVADTTAKLAALIGAV